jgi:hypothetical protein
VSGYSGGEPADMFGHALNPQPVAPEFRALFPDLAAKQAPGGREQEKRTLVYPPKPQGKKRRGKPKVVK